MGVSKRVAGLMGRDAEAEARKLVASWRDSAAHWRRKLGEPRSTCPECKGAGRVGAPPDMAYAVGRFAEDARPTCRTCDGLGRTGGTDESRQGWSEAARMLEGCAAELEDAAGRWW